MAEGAMQKGMLEPRSRHDQVFGRIKKVFIAYVHNPNVYENYIPAYPLEQLFQDPSLQQQVLQEKQLHEERQKAIITEHTELVSSFASCLVSSGVAVAYDGYFQNQRMECTHQFYEQQIRDSDFVLLIVTPSLRHYLENEPPEEEPMAPLFSSKALYNMMTVQLPPGTHFIPVFLNQPKDINLIPTCLASSTTFMVQSPFNVQQGGLYDLYNLLTNQQANRPPDPGPPILLPQRPRFGRGLVGKSSSMTAPQRHALETLRSKNTEINLTVLLKASRCLSGHWKLIGQKLGLSERELSECAVQSEADQNEACYQMLCRWKSNMKQRATLSELATVVAATNYTELLLCLV